MQKKGFTLVELLIVIGILAILVAAVVVVLNPAQLLAQARDGQRMSDLDAVRSAINLYMTTASSVAFTATTTLTATTTGAPATWTGAVVNASTAVTNAGWVNIDLSSISGGSPLSRLPIDPTNSGSYQYGYRSNAASTTYKLISRLESTKYRANMATDGGAFSTCSTYAEATCWYEIGNDVTNL